MERGFVQSRPQTRDLGSTQRLPEMHQHPPLFTTQPDIHSMEAPSHVPDNGVIHPWDCLSYGHAVNPARSPAKKGRRPMCRVLEPIRRVRPDHYDPEIISFGLYDRNLKKATRADLQIYEDELRADHLHILQKLKDEVLEEEPLQQPSQKGKEGPRVEPFGLQAPKKLKRMTRMDQQREEVVKSFLKITGLKEMELRLKVVPEEDLEDILAMYDDGFLMLPELARHLLTLDAVFLASFMLYMFRECIRSQSRDESSTLHHKMDPKDLHLLSDQIKLKHRNSNVMGIHIEGTNCNLDFAPLLAFFDELGMPCNGHMMRSDLWLLENQIPLSLIRNVMKIMYGSKEEPLDSLRTNCSKEENAANSHVSSGKDPQVPSAEASVEVAFKSLLKVALANVLPQVPGDCSSKSAMSDRIEKVQFEDCEHLLECLYRTVCPKPEPRCIQRQSLETRNEDPEGVCRSSCSIDMTHSSRFSGNAELSRVHADGDRMEEQESSRKQNWSLLSMERMRVSSSKKTLLPKEKVLEDEDLILPKHNHKLLLPPVSDLQKAGINVRGEKSRGCTLEFKEATTIYQKATLCLPQLHIDDSTERILRNLVAFESTVSINGYEHVLMSYLQCMNDLVNTEDDVRLLMLGRDPVIRLSFLGENKDVAVMFNNLIQHCYFEHTPQSTQLRKQVNVCYKKKFRHLYTEFVETHCSRPWIVMSLFAATFLLCVTAIQTTYDLIGFYGASPGS